MDLFYDVGFIPIMLDLFQLCWIYSNYVGFIPIMCVLVFLRRNP